MAAQTSTTLQALNPNNVAQKSPASRADRPLSFQVADFPPPSHRAEEWRFAPLRRLSAFFDATVEQVVHEHTDSAGVSITAEGISLETVRRDDARLGQAQAPEDQLGALAWERAPQAHVVTIPADTELAHEAIVRIYGQDATPEDQPVRAAQLLIDADARSRGTVVLVHTGSATLTEGVEILVGDGAHLTLVSVQDWNDDAIHALSLRARVGTDATLKHIVVSLGGAVVRVTSALEYAGTGGDAELLGAYFADTGQHLEHRLFVDHNQPKCRSNVLYKGALHGDGAHAVWVGDVLIRPNAEGISTYELNRNLVLSDGPRADSVPNLEIETGKIEGAGHASATGRFDDEQLFYLLSRGIPEKEAHRLVVMGFFGELINQIGVPSVQEKLLAHIEATLDKFGQESPEIQDAEIQDASTGDSGRLGKSEQLGNPEQPGNFDQRSAPVSFSDAEIGRAASANEGEEDEAAA
ncbi:MAG: Fe-S cluster assembly protein SufD [Actinomycetaceae bacterium]|nr:Fe-S cluster assembly protein SufD [Actinomycetaceae bacterium]MDY5855033.1 Fe-S cluster assembly protein SufD [Arcanobacterium sp.]